MKLLISILFCALVASSSLSAQASIEEQVILKIIKNLDSIYSFPFMEKELIHHETSWLSQRPFDTSTIYNPDTYEEVLIQNLEYKIILDSINLEEAKLYRKRRSHPEGVYSISKIQPHSRYADLKLDEYLNLTDYPSVGAMPVLLDSLFEDNYIGKYVVNLATEENTNTFKYATKAQLAFSGVQWNKFKTYCVIEYGFQYRYEVGGNSGSGGFVVLKKSGSSVEIVKFIPLWES